LRVLDAQGEASFASNHIHVECANGHAWRDFVLVWFRTKRLWLRRSARQEKVLRESSGRRIESDGFSLKMQYGKACGSLREVNLVVSGGADGVVAGLEPFQSDEREPAVRLQ